MPRNSCTYKISGTTSFRLASSKILGKWGTNLQNIEKSARQLYVPDEGKIFVQVDQSGAEALVVSYLCRKGNYRDLFLHNVKPHVFVALHVFADEWQRRMDKAGGIDIKCDIKKMCNTAIPELKLQPFWKQLDTLIKSSDGWSAGERYYYLAKQTCHSANYDIKPSTFQLNLLEKSKGKIAISKKQAEYYLGSYHGLFPEIQDWHRAVQQQVLQTRTLYNLQGFPRYFTQYNFSDSFWKECYAFSPQSTVGTITNVAYTNLQQLIESAGLKWDLLANTHDSYLVQCPIAEAQECAKTMKQFIEQDLVSPRGEKFKMKAEAKAGFNWNDFSEDKNPQGLKEVIL